MTTKAETLPPLARTAPDVDPNNDHEERAFARELVLSHGQVRAAKMLGIARGTLANFIADIGTLRGTRALIRERVRVLRARAS